MSGLQVDVGHLSGVETSRRADAVPLELFNSRGHLCTRAIGVPAVLKLLRLRLESLERLEPPLLQCMGRYNSQSQSERAKRQEGPLRWKRERPTRHQATAPTLNVGRSGVASFGCSVRAPQNFVKPPGYGSSRGDLAPSLSYEVLAKAKQIYREDYLLYERLKRADVGTRVETPSPR